MYPQMVTMNQDQVAPASILGSVATGTGASSSGVSTNHTLEPGSNRIIVACVFLWDPDDNIVSCNYDSGGTPIAMTATTQIASGNFHVRIFYLLEADLPGNGTYTAGASFSGGGTNRSGIAVYAIEGLPQQAPVEAGGAKSGDPISQGITTTRNGAFIIDAAMNNAENNTLEPGTGQTELFDFGQATSRYGGSWEIGGGAGSHTQTYESNGSPTTWVYKVLAW